MRHLPAVTQGAQAREEKQRARTLQWGNPAADLFRADIPQRPQLRAPGPRTRRRNPRKLARSQPLPQYGRTSRSEENRTTRSRMTSTMNANLQNLTHTTNEGTVTEIGREHV